MTLTSQAFILLSAQRYHLEGRPDERELSREWLRQLEQARAAGEMIVLVQWDGDEGSDHETFSKGWTLYPDFRAEAGELLTRAKWPNAFAGSELEAELHGRAVRHLRLVGLDNEALSQTTQAARNLGFEAEVLTGEASL